MSSEAILFCSQLGLTVEDVDDDKNRESEVELALEALLQTSTVDETSILADERRLVLLVVLVGNGIGLAALEEVDHVVCCRKWLRRVGGVGRPEAGSVGDGVERGRCCWERGKEG